MNLQRREEIRAIATEFRRLFLHEQAEAIDELLTYVDALEQAAAERVIADGGRGSVVVPAAVAPESLLHDLAVAAWDEGADAGMAWDPDAAPAKRGVVPCTPEEGIAKARDHFARHGSGSPGSAFSRALQAIRENSRVIPADHVPGDGMVAVDREEWSDMLNLVAALLMDEDAYDRVDDLLRPIGDRREAKDGIGWIGALCDEMGAIDTLRANQGGVAT